MATTTVDPDGLLGLTEVAHILGKTRQYVWNRAARDETRPPDKDPLFALPCARVQATTLWDAAALRAWIRHDRGASDDVRRERVARLDALLRARTKARRGVPRGAFPRPTV